MTAPQEYQQATQDFERFMIDAREAAGHTTTNQTYTMVQGVFQAFRRRLSVTDAIAFAQVLPALLRALFVADWDTTEPQRSFDDRETITKEVQALRAAHNFAPDTSIRDVAVALHQNIPEAILNETLARLPEDAQRFWDV
jgi:uncharacterized protein (DUF2267 family)